jgi:AhpC/TSA family
MYPYERSLVEKLSNKPFAMIGVNSEPTSEALQQTVIRERMNWRNFYDGGPIQPIARAWNVSAWPTTYILDGDGVIRYRNLRGEPCTTAIELLLGMRTPDEAVSQEGVAQYANGSLMWSGTPRSIIRIRRNRRFPGHTGWCLNTNDPEELTHTAERHQEVVDRSKEKMENLNSLKGNPVLASETSVAR